MSTALTALGLSWYVISSATFADHLETPRLDGAFSADRLLTLQLEGATFLDHFLAHQLNVAYTLQITCLRFRSTMRPSLRYALGCGFVCLLVLWLFSRCMGRYRYVAIVRVSKYVSRGRRKRVRSGCLFSYPPPGFLSPSKASIMLYHSPGYEDVFSSALKLSKTGFASFELLVLRQNLERFGELRTVR